MSNNKTVFIKGLNLLRVISLIQPSAYLSKTMGSPLARRCREGALGDLGKVGWVAPLPLSKITLPRDGLAMELSDSTASIED